MSVLCRRLVSKRRQQGPYIACFVLAHMLRVNRQVGSRDIHGLVFGYLWMSVLGQRYAMRYTGSRVATIREGQEGI